MAFWPLRIGELKLYGLEMKKMMMKMLEDYSNITRSDSSETSNRITQFQPAVKNCLLLAKRTAGVVWQHIFAPK